MFQYLDIITSISRTYKLLPLIKKRGMKLKDSKHYKELKKKKVINISNT